VRAIQPTGQTDHLQRIDLWPVNVRGASDRGLPPVDHQLVWIVEQFTWAARDRCSRFQFERLGDAMGRVGPWIIGKGQLQIALCQFVVILWTGDDAIGVDNRCVIMGDLGHQAVVSPDEQRLHLCAIHDVGGVVHI
jgi:hypothetical protein